MEVFEGHSVCFWRFGESRGGARDDLDQSVEGKLGAMP
jgi:hypothetical protein